MKVRELMKFLSVTDPDTEVRFRIEALDRFGENQVVLEGGTIAIEDGNVGYVVVVGEEP